MKGCSWGLRETKKLLHMTDGKKKGNDQEAQKGDEPPYLRDEDDEILNESLRGNRLHGKYQ